MKNWTKEFSLKYMTAHPDEFYLNKLQHRFDKFDVKNVCQKHFKAFKNIESVCDIGAGVLGGALALFPYGSMRTIVDLLADKFVEIDKLPEGVYAYPNDFDNTEFETNSQDVLFSWECLDHAQTLDHFIQGQKELVRILKPGGLLFFYLPLRKDPKNAHLIIRTEEEILIEFSKLELISNEIEIGWDRYERGMYAIFTKEDPLDK